jgi:hypothetical protein
MRKTLVLLLIIMLCGGSAVLTQKRPAPSGKKENTAAGKKSSSGVKRARTNYYSKTKGKAKGKTKKTRSVRRSTAPLPPKEDIIKTVAPGVVYSFHQYKKLFCDVHTVTVDLSDPGISVELAKGVDHIAGLERVFEIAERMNTGFQGARRVLAGINANFWKAGTHHPMGPTVINGVTLVNQKYSNWPSVVIGKSGAMHIDEYSMSSEIKTRYGSIPIHKYNFRDDSLSVVVYTKYFGSSVPFVDIDQIQSVSQDSITDESETEQLFSSTVDSLVSSHPEIGTLKIQFQYIQKPMANSITQCRITNIDTGLVIIPPDGGVLSFGRGRFPLFFSLFVGDTFTVASRVFPTVEEPVMQMACGTPLLVREGRNYVKSNPSDVGRIKFVTARYARSAIGISRDGKKLILTTVEAPHRGTRKQGISLANLADILIEHGAYSAMNFDGGGSATMVVGDETVSPPNANHHSRKISTALMVIKSGTAK